ncbi:MAG: hypothetical protein IJL33_08765, partial [Ruminococcus sp.]|nr:hypothetical protein [Ruminococcus sp.]
SLQANSEETATADVSSRAAAFFIFSIIISPFGSEYTLSHNILYHIILKKALKILYKYLLTKSR